MSKKWTDWIPHEETAPFPYKGEVVQLQTLPDGSVRYKRLRKNVEAEEAARVKSNAAISEGMPKVYVDFDWSRKPFSDRMFKRRSDTAENNASEPETPNPATTPKTIITGPGEYVTADGQKAVVCEVASNTPWAATGYVESLGYGVTWNQWGECLDWPHDITGPWQEPEKAEPHVIEGWVNVYENSVSGHFGRVYPTEDMAHLNKAKDSHAPYLATIRISYTIEDTTQ